MQSPLSPSVYNKQSIRNIATSQQSTANGKSYQTTTQTSRGSSRHSDLQKCSVLIQEVDQPHGTQPTWKYVPPGPPHFCTSLEVMMMMVWSLSTGQVHAGGKIATKSTRGV